MKYCSLLLVVTFFSCYNDVQPPAEFELQTGFLSRFEYSELQSNLWKVSPYIYISDTIGGYLHMNYHTGADTLDSVTFKSRYMDNIAVSMYKNAFRNSTTGKIDYVYTLLTVVYHVYSIKPPFDSLLYCYSYKGSDPLFARIQ